MKNVFSVLLIGLFFFATLLSPLTQQLSAINQTQMLDDSLLVRVHTTEIQQLPSNIEIISGKPGNYLDVVIDKPTLTQLSKQDISYTVRSHFFKQIDQSVVKTYPTFKEIEQHLQNVATNHADITNLFSIGQSYQERELWCLEITDNPGVDEGEPEVLFMGLHHAREWPTVVITLSIIEELVESYGKDANVTNLINHRRVWVIPCVNPDGYYYDHDQYDGAKWWRKNRHYFPEYHVYGVDLNRNYGGASNGNPLSMWGSTGISHNHESAVFCGSEPFSELEIKHIKQFFLNHTIDASISWHTFGELVMWPWAYSTTDQAPNNEYMTEIGKNIAQEIAQNDGTGSYYPTQSSGLYPTAGDTTDWFYGYSHYVLGRPHFAYTIEACDEFHPDEEHLEQVCRENVEGALILLQEAEQIVKEPRRVLPPHVTEIEKIQNNTLVVNWEEQNPDANMNKLAVQTLSNYQIIVDQVLQNECYWDLTDFTLSSTHAHSGEFSFHSHKKDDLVSAMTSRYPLYVTNDMKLSFWCYYDTEEEYDFAFVEISPNGRTFTPLDSFNGTSDEWIYKEYDLQEYSGQSVYIRFRYFTDQNTHDEGFWVDDIFPVSTVQNVEIIAENITSSPFTLHDPADNTSSYFRIRGYNDEYQWGDFSKLYPLTEYTENSNPTTPVISGDIKGKTNQNYTYTIRSIDLDQDELYYQVQWGDGNQTDWLGPYPSGESMTIEHTWTEEGTYYIKARSKDTNEAMSDWGELQIQMPYLIKHPLFYRLQQIIQWVLSFS